MHSGSRPVRLLVLILTLAAAGDVYTQSTFTVFVGPGLQFSPSNLTIQPGDTVRWEFRNFEAHSTTSDLRTGPEVWDSGIRSSGTFSHTFNTAGTHRYYCSPHSFPGGTAMNGTIRVQQTCTNVTISSQPSSTAIAPGGTANLSVTASGTAPFTYQWFIGNIGNTTNPIAGASSSSISVSPSSTTSYWVRVTNCSGAGVANSNAATVTVTACIPPSITTQPQNRSIAAGGTTSLSVSAGGTTPFSYQWFTGSSGDMGSPIAGATGSAVTVHPSTTTSYWVRVTGQCPPSANSATATVTVQPCVAPNITSHPQGSIIQAGQSGMLVVTATGSSLIYEWFRGLRGEVSSGVLGTGPSFDTGPLMESTHFWVRVTNSCGSADSDAALVVVQTPCAMGHACLLNGRFEIALFARDQRTGATAIGQPQPENDLFAFFSLASLTGSAEIPEVFVKILDATSLPGQNFWVFYSGLTDLEYNLVVTDKHKNQQKIFIKEAGSLCGNTDQSTFALGAGAERYDSAGPGNSSASLIQPDFTCSLSSLCLLGTRFEVALTARDQRTGRTATGIPVPKADGFGYFSLTELTGDPRVPEVFVKMIDATAPPFNKFWVFHGGLTDLEYTLTVRDNVRGTTKTYTKSPGSFCGEADTGAFDP